MGFGEGFGSGEGGLESARTCRGDTVGAGVFGISRMFACDLTGRYLVLHLIRAVRQALLLPRPLGATIRAGPFEDMWSRGALKAKGSEDGMGAMRGRRHRLDRW